jgi:chromosome partitioning protein
VRTVALISTKGGTGKSSLAQCLSVAAAMEGKSVYLLDLDPQQSAAAWWHRRPDPNNPMLIDADSASQAIDRVRKRRALRERDWLIIDTPGAFLNLLNDVIYAADVLVIVTKASMKDLEAQQAAEDLIRDAGRKERVIWAINMVDGRTPAITKAAVDEIRKRGFPEPITINHAVEFIRADEVGKTANETSGRAKREIDNLWQAVKGMEDGN